MHGGLQRGLAHAWATQHCRRKLSISLLATPASHPDSVSHPLFSIRRPPPHQR